MSATRLTQRRVESLRPGRNVRDIRDTELKGYGVRVMPSGAKRYFIHSQNEGRRVWKIVGDAGAMGEAEARARARAMLAAHRDGRDPDAMSPGDTPFEIVAREVLDRYARRWKPGTQRVNRIYFREQILPFFEGRPIASISREDVQAWFRSLHATPRGREPLRSHPIDGHAPGGGMGLPTAGQQPPAGASAATGRGVPSASCPPRSTAASPGCWSVARRIGRFTSPGSASFSSRDVASPRS